jgi:hypothetical protein
MIPIRSLNLDKIIKEHCDYIMLYFNKRNRIGKLDAINNWVADVFGRNYTLEDILKATPEKISYFVKKHDLVKPPPNVEILSLRNLYSRFAVASKSPFLNYSAFELIDKLGITVCPYCNRNYIINVKGRNRRTCEIDHFWNKQNYPFLSLSFFNLIPSCKTCNHLKSNIPGNYYNPYNSSMNSDDLIKFSFKVIGPEYIDRKEHLELVTKHSRSFETNVKNLAIIELYNSHIDIIQELIKKKSIYNEEYIEQLVKDFEGRIFKNREELIGLILSNFTTEEELHKRPFAKLTKDIWEQLN